MASFPALPFAANNTDRKLLLTQSDSTILITNSLVSIYPVYTFHVTISKPIVSVRSTSLYK